MPTPLAHHSQREANHLSVGHLWPDGFFVSSSAKPTSELSILLPLQLILSGDQNTQAVIDTADSVTSSWTVWRTVVIGDNGTTEVDLDKGAEKRGKKSGKVVSGEARELSIVFKIYLAS